MPPKKNAGAQADPEDVSVEQFWKFYRKGCSQLEITTSPCLKALYEQYVEENLLIQKVSKSQHTKGNSLRTISVDSCLGRDGLVRGQGDDRCYDTGRLSTLQEYQALASQGTR